RQDPEVEEFLLDCFQQCGVKAGKKSAALGVDLAARLASLLYGLRTPRAFAAILARRDELPAVSFILVLGSALSTWPPEKVYDEFSPLVAETKGDGKAKCGVLKRVLVRSRRQAGAPEVWYDAEPPSAETDGLAN